VVTNCDHLKELKFSPQLPHVFTEQGVAMLSGLLNSQRAILVNIAIMRAFVKLRQFITTHKELAAKLSEVEGKVNKHDKEIRLVFDMIRRLMADPELPKDDYKRTKLGFKV
jgi:predicted membrane-bound spermidine synthase